MLYTASLSTGVVDELRISTKTELDAKRAARFGSNHTLRGFRGLRLLNYSATIDV